MQVGSGVDTYEAEIAADLIIWELIARKSAECLNLCNSFITISTLNLVLEFLDHFYIIILTKSADTIETHILLNFIKQLSVK